MGKIQSPLRYVLVFSLLLPGAVLSAPAQAPGFAVETLAEGLANPWAIAFLPDGSALITERIGRLRRFNGGALSATEIEGLPPITQHGQGGLLGIALHPDYRNNALIYLSYAGRDRDGYSTEVLRGRYDGQHFEPLDVIFRATPRARGGRHFGGRLIFDDGGYLYVSLGDRGDRELAQDLSVHAGSLIRLHDDGRIPADNPFAGDAAVAPGIFTYGNRNIQGLALHPGSREVWTHEHGPQGGDEVNVMRVGANYGWPVITYGRNYGIGTKIGEGTAKAGMAQPLHKWVPSIAPSGMSFYHGDPFPQWQGDLFVGSLKFGLLVRLIMDKQTIVGEQRFLDDQYGRIRDVKVGPDGFVYLLTDERAGKLLRLVPRE